MNDYEPLDITRSCNVGLDALGPGRSPATGDVCFHGLPFRVAPGDYGRCFIMAGPAESQTPTAFVRIPVDNRAQWVIFAHVMLDSEIHQGDPPGREVGRYRIVYTDGEQMDVPIRERFEVAIVPTGWGEPPFLAVPDRADSLKDRYEGRWENTGSRQIEAIQGWATDYYLFAWQNTRPDSVISCLEVLPASEPEGERHRGSSRLLLAAVTLGHLVEEPFRRSAAVPVKLALLRPDDARTPFGLSVEVDRGVATYPYPLPRESADDYIRDSQRGWGEEMNRASSPAYTTVAATPSATVTVKRDGEEIGRARWGELEENRVVETERVRFEIVDTGRNWVHTTVVDDATGKPIPCRIHFRSPDGIPYQPHGHHTHVLSDQGTWHIDVGGDVRLGQISYAYIDGRCQGWLPRGEVIVDVARGYEYEPLRTRVDLGPGQRELELRIRRTADLNAARYFSGDTHVHFLSTQGALTEAAAEDLDLVNLLQSQWGHLYTNTEEFTGRPAVAADGETIVYATQENRQHLLGHLTLLGLKEPVMPWCSGGPGEAEMGGNLETTLSHWADACHAQGGTVVIPHLPNPNAEPATLIATARADAVEMLQHNPFFHLEYYRYLNGGYRLPLAGGTDKMDSGVPVGLYRTYAYIPPDRPFTYDNWCAALRSGNTFLSGGPLLRFTVNGQPVGSTVALGHDGGTVEFEATATSIFPIHALEIVTGIGLPKQGSRGAVEQHRVVARADEKNGAKRLEVRTSVKVDSSTWFCARCAGPAYTAIQHHDTWRRGIMAHTSPIYVACGDYDVCSPQTMHYMLTLMDGSLQYIRKRAPQWNPGSVTHHHGEEDHQAFLERPFHEAIAAAHRRMHAHGIDQ